MSLGLLALICIIMVPPVSAFTATLVKPASETTPLHPGDKIQIDLTGLANGNAFTYHVTSSDLTPLGNTITLPSTNMPFDLQNGLTESTVTTTGITATTHTFTVTKDGGAAMTKTGAATLTSAYNIKHGNYVVTIMGTRTGSSVGIDYNVTGVADNSAYAIPDPASLTFDVEGIYAGHLTIKINQGADEKLSKTFTISPAPTPVPTPAGGGETGGGGQQGGQQQQGQQQAQQQQQQAQLAAIQAVIAQLAPPGTAPTVVDMKYEAATGTLESYTIEADPASGISVAVDIAAGTITLSVNGQAVTSVTVSPADISSFSSDYGVDTNGMVTLV